MCLRCARAAPPKCWETFAVQFVLKQRLQGLASFLFFFFLQNLPRRQPEELRLHAAVTRAMLLCCCRLINSGPQSLCHRRPSRCGGGNRMK